MLLVSNKAVENIVTGGKAVARQDNLLKEWELAVDKLARDPLHIVPVLIGEYVQAGMGMGIGARRGSSPQLYQKFSAFGGLPARTLDFGQDRGWPDAHSVTCKTRTIKQTMSALFKINGGF